MGFLPVKEGFVSIDGELLTVRSAHAFRSLMVYLPQEMQRLTHHYRAPQPPVCEAEEYGVWNALLPPSATVPQPEPLTPEEIFSLAERTLCEAADKPIVIADEPAAHLTPELTQRMFILYYGYGMKLGDIAKETGTSAVVVKSRLARVRRKLRTSLGEENAL